MKEKQKGRKVSWKRMKQAEIPNRSGIFSHFAHLSSGDRAEVAKKKDNDEKRAFSLVLKARSIDDPEFSIWISLFLKFIWSHSRKWTAIISVPNCFARYFTSKLVSKKLSCVSWHRVDWLDFYVILWQMLQLLTSISASTNFNQFPSPTSP